MAHATKQRGARRWASVADGAKYVGVSSKTFRRMIAAGTVPAYRMAPRVLRVDLNELDAVMRPIPTAGRDDSVGVA